MPKRSLSHMWTDAGLCIACKMWDDWPGASQLCPDAAMLVNHNKGSENSRKRIEKYTQKEK